MYTVIRRYEGFVLGQNLFRYFIDELDGGRSKSTTHVESKLSEVVWGPTNFDQV